MKAVVVYESLWGNTAAVAKAIAEGIGPGTEALTTEQASPTVLRDADLVVAGAPVVAFGLPSDAIREKLAADPGKAPTPPDLAHQSMRAWLAELPVGQGRAAAFETGLRWSPGCATSTISRGLQAAGYRPALKSTRFVVKGMYGPLRPGELEKARAWGAALAQAVS